MTRGDCEHVSRLLNAYTSDLLAAEGRTVSDTRLRLWLRSGSGDTAARRLRNWMDDEGFDRSEAGEIRANDVFWLWIAYLFKGTTPEAQRLSTDERSWRPLQGVEIQGLVAASRTRCVAIYGGFGISWV